MASSHDGLPIHPPPSPTPSSVLSARQQHSRSPYSSLPPPSPSNSTLAAKPPLPRHTSRFYRFTPSRPIRRRPPTHPPYIPPFRQKRKDAQRKTPVAKTDEEGQKRAWISMKKNINGVVNKVNTDNIHFCLIQLFRVNLVRGRGIFCKSLLRAQFACPSMSPIFACLVAVVGSRFPAIAELFVYRLVAQLKSSKKDQDLRRAFATTCFLAHLVNQQVIDEILVLEFLSDCMMESTDSSIEMAVTTLRHCGQMLSERAPRALEPIFQGLRKILHDGELSKRVQTLVDKIMALRRTNFSSDPVLDQKLDLLHKEDVIIHSVSLKEDDNHDLEYPCNNFQLDPEYEENEREYDYIRKDLLGIYATEVSSLNAPDTSDDVPVNETPQANDQSTSTPDRNQVHIFDMTDADLNEIRSEIYLTHVSTLSYEESAHKLLRLMTNHPGKEKELCRMIIESCSHEKSFLRSYGLLGQRLCMLSTKYKTQFEKLFAEQYAVIHRYEARKIRNIASFYASLLEDVLTWDIFHIVCIEEKETTTSSRIFLKVLFQEISSSLGESKMKKAVKEAEDAGHFSGVFPSDNARNMRFAINFFVKIELGFLTDSLREKLKKLPANQLNEDSSENDSDSDESSSSSSLSSSSLSSSSGEENVYPAVNRGSEEREQTSAVRERARNPSSAPGGPHDNDENKSRDAAANEARLGRRQDDGSTVLVNRDGHMYEEIERNHREYVGSPSRATSHEPQANAQTNHVQDGISRFGERPRGSNSDRNPRLDERERPTRNGDSRRDHDERRRDIDDRRGGDYRRKSPDRRGGRRRSSLDRGESEHKKRRRYSRRSHLSEDYSGDDADRRRRGYSRERSLRDDGDAPPRDEITYRGRYKRGEDRYRSISPHRSHRRYESDRGRKSKHRYRSDRRGDEESDYSSDYHRSSDRRRDYRQHRSNRYRSSRDDRSVSSDYSGERSRSPPVDRKRVRVG